MLKLSDLSLIRSYEMPDSMRFNEEGGASLSPDGKSFLAVSYDPLEANILRHNISL